MIWRQAGIIAAMKSAEEQYPDELGP